MRASLTVSTNPFHPASGRQQHILCRRRSLAALARAHCDLSHPTLCLVNGVPALRATWRHRRVRDGDTINFVRLPQGGGGGGGSNPLRTVLSIAVLVVASVAGGPLGAALGFTGATATAVGSALISVAGSLLVNALVPPPKPASGAQVAELAAPSPTYTVGAQGNTARLGSPIPVIYGRHLVFPDFAAQPYTEFVGNEQYLYQLFVIGQGDYTLSDIKIEDTPLAGFEDYLTQQVAPGGSVTLFPAAVVTSGEVSGQEAGSLGPFVVNAAGTQINAIAVDVVCPRGLYFANDAGGLTSKTTTFRVEATPINDAGAATGPAVTLGNESISGATTTAIRRSYRYGVAPGRYSVSLTRTDAKDANARAGHELGWFGLRGYLPGTQAYGNVTLLALRIRASNNLSSQSARRVNCIAERKLPAYVAGTAQVPAATRSIAWAIADMCTAAYGAGMSTAQFDVAALQALHTTWAARGDTFDAVIDTQMTIWEALTHACRAGRVLPYIQGGVLRFARDELKTIPTALFGMRNIVRGSLRLQYLMEAEDTADAVEMEYFDESVWQPRRVLCQLPGGSAAKIARVRAFGLVQRAQAAREGFFIAADNRYRRKLISFQTELEGHVPSPGDLVLVQHDMPAWGQGGEILAWDAGTRTATTSEPLDFSAGGTHVMALRRRDGSVSGPWTVTAGADPHLVVFALGQPDLVPDTGLDRERTHYAFGPSALSSQQCKIVKLRPRGATVEVTALAEDVRVHEADSTTPPTTPTPWQLPVVATAPVLADFAVIQGGAPGVPTLTLSWLPAPGATDYLVDLSYDNATWQRLGTTSDASYTFTTTPGVIWLRVAAFGAVRGPYVVRSVTVGTVAPPSDVGTVSGVVGGTFFDVSWPETARAESYFLEVREGATVRRSVTQPGTSYRYTHEMAAADGVTTRTVTFAVKGQNASALSSNFSLLALTNAAPAAPPAPTVLAGVSSVTISVPRSTETDVAGIIIWAGDAAGFTVNDAARIYDGPDTAYTLHGVTAAKHFRVAYYDVWGKTSLNVSAEVSASPTPPGGVTIAASLPGTTYLGDDVVYYPAAESLYEWDAALIPPAYVRAEPLVAADRIVALNLQAISAQMGDLNSGTITLDAGGHVKGGQTGYNTGTGYWLGYDAGSYKFSWENGLGESLTLSPGGQRIEGNLTVISNTDTPVNLVASTSTPVTGLTVSNVFTVAPERFYDLRYTDTGTNDQRIAANIVFASAAPANGTYYDTAPLSADEPNIFVVPVEISASSVAGGGTYPTDQSPVIVQAYHAAPFLAAGGGAINRAQLQFTAATGRTLSGVEAYDSRGIMRPELVIADRVRVMSARIPQTPGLPTFGAFADVAMKQHAHYNPAAAVVVSSAAPVSFDTAVQMDTERPTLVVATVRANRRTGTGTTAWLTVSITVSPNGTPVTYAAPSVLLPDTATPMRYSVFFAVMPPVTADADLVRVTIANTPNAGQPGAVTAGNVDVHEATLVVM